MHPLHQLQDRMHLYTSGKEEESAQRVIHFRLCIVIPQLTLATSAKYIEGLENRMKRLEGLLKMAGLADSETDLPSIERRLHERTQASQPTPSNGMMQSAMSSALANARSGSLQSTPQMDSISSPRATDSPESHEGKEYEVETLSDMMCSLVTNNIGETRYIGELALSPIYVEFCRTKYL